MKADGETERRGEGAIRRAAARLLLPVAPSPYLPALPFILPPSSLVSERDADLTLEGARADEVRAAEGREEVVERLLVRQVDGREAERHLRVLCAQEVVGSGAQVEEVARGDARRVRVVVLCPVRGNPHAQSAARRRSARSYRLSRRGEDAAAEQSDLRLLIRREGQSGGEVWNRARHEAAVIAPVEVHVRHEPLEALELVAH